MVPDLDKPALAPVRQFFREGGGRVWLTGGTVRDLLLGREPHDIDLVIAGRPEEPARLFAEATGGSFFPLSEEFQTFRVVSADRLYTYDFAACRGLDIEDDLRCRDFTIDAMALALPGSGKLPAREPLSDSGQWRPDGRLSGGGNIIDPTGGAADLASHRIDAVDEKIFSQDPLRLLRALRLERQLNFSIAARTEKLMRASASLASRPAPERIYAELTQLLAAPGGATAVRRLDKTGLLAVVFPEVEALKSITQNDYHHLDVYEHTLAAMAVMDRLVENPAAFFPGCADWLQERLCPQSGVKVNQDSELDFDDSISRGPILGFGDNVSQGFILGFAELMHDIGKPGSAFVDSDGQKRFFEHDRLGAEMVRKILTRLRASSRTTVAISHLVATHMRFESLVSLDPASPRARLRYLRATAPLTPEAIMMSVADRLSVRGRLVTETDIERHLALAREMMDAAFTAETARPLPRLVDGDDLIRQFGLRPGPRIGQLLEVIAEEQALGKISNRDEAIAAARFLQEENIPGPNNKTGPKIDRHKK